MQYGGSEGGGTTYVGNWLGDKKHGHGVMEWRERHERYVGAWRADHPDGHGEHVWRIEAPEDAALRQMCNRYRGEWRGGERHGAGTFFYADGSLYEGEWVCGEKHGEGVYVLPGGAVYEGAFAHDQARERLLSLTRRSLTRPDGWRRISTSGQPV